MPAEFNLFPERLRKPRVWIETAQPLTGCRLKVLFHDGREGIYPVEPERELIGICFLTLRGSKHKDYLGWHIHYHLGPDEKRRIAKFTGLLRKHGHGPVYEPQFAV